MCLTGVDYFSTLGYQPGIAFLAAGLLSPVATLVLVLVTLFGALPVYNRVAEASPNGQGSIGMLEKLFPQWSGKTFVLILLGFATTDFVITLTLSAADAAAHVTHNPFTPDWIKSQMVVTLVLLAILGAIFLKGFSEAISIAVVLVATYLGLNVVVTAVAIREIVRAPDLLSHWKAGALLEHHGSPLAMLGIAILLFPKLALGLSGFETGVAVMPLVEGTDLAERIRNTRKLLFTAAAIMSVFLIATSFVTTLLIKPVEFQEGGEANGRALAYLAHKYLGNTFGSVYDVSTILILAFAGASAMAGLLNLIPRYLPRFGMAPEWARGLPSAGAGVHCGRLRGHVSFPCGRGRARRCLCHRRVGVDDISGMRGMHFRLERTMALAISDRCAGVHLHHYGQYLRASGRDQDRVGLHRNHDLDVADFPSAAIDRTAYLPGRIG